MKAIAASQTDVEEALTTPAPGGLCKPTGARAMDQESKREVLLLASGTMILMPIVASIAFAVFSQMH